MGAHYQGIGRPNRLNGLFEAIDRLICREFCA